MISYYSTLIELIVTLAVRRWVFHMIYRPISNIDSPKQTVSKIHMYVVLLSQ